MQNKSHLEKPLLSIADIPAHDHHLLDGLSDDDHLIYALLAGRNGGQTLIGGTLTGQDLVLQDNAVDGNQITLNQTGLVPNNSATLSLGTTSLFFKTLFLQNDGGNVINMAHAGIVGQKTEYTVAAGGGNLYGGNLLFQFEPAFQSQGSENRYIIDFGVVDVLGAQHAYVFRSTANAPIVGDLQVETLFGGILGDGNLGIKFSSSGYFCYRNVINSNMAFGGNEFVADTDPQGTGTGGQALSKKNFQIQMDGNTCFKVNTDIGWNTFYPGVANMAPSPADYGTVAIDGSVSTRLGANKTSRSSLNIDPPTYDLNGFTLNYAAGIRVSGNPTGGAAGNAGILMDSGASILFGQLGFGGVGTALVGGNLFGPDILVASASTTNAPVNFNLVPNGTSQNSKIALFNTVNWLFTQTYSVLDIEANAAVCRFMLRQVAATTPITDMDIGGDATSGLVDINFKFLNVTKLNLTPTNMVLADPYDIVLGTVTGTKIGTATTQKLGFYNATPIVRPGATGASGWAAGGGGVAVSDLNTFTGGVGVTAYTIGDIVAALKNLGLITP